MTALKNDFSVERVSQELRNQFPDHELRHRDPHGRSSAMAAEEWSEDEALASSDLSMLAQEGMNDQGLILMEEAEDTAQEALAAIERGRRTLREARARQHQVRMSRQYYRSDRTQQKSSPWQSSNSQRPSGSSSCLKCGSSGHRTAQCPKKSEPQGTAHTAQNESAPFVCFTESIDKNEAHFMGDGLTSEEAMRQGKAILDGGATRTLGSVTAVEQVMDLNEKLTGATGIRHIDTSQRPTFGFGNSSSDQCLSTAWLTVLAGGREGELKVHTLDRGNSPILFSIETLRSLGPVIDFKEDLIVFRELDSKRIIRLERSCTGHQLLPLTEDWFKNSFVVQEPVRSLKDLH